MKPYKPLLNEMSTNQMIKDIVKMYQDNMSSSQFRGHFSKLVNFIAKSLHTSAPVVLQALGMMGEDVEKWGYNV